MTLPASPPISLSDVCTEFSAPANEPLASFLRGGAFVPDTGTNAGVPNALPITLLSLLGASALPGGSVNIGDHTITSTRVAGTAGVMYQFTSAGAVNWSSTGVGSGSYAGEWLVSGSAAAYDVRVTGAALAALSGIANNVWQNAASTWSATLSAGPSVEDFLEAITVEIRPTGGGATLATAVISLFAERLP